MKLEVGQFIRYEGTIYKLNERNIKGWKEYFKLVETNDLKTSHNIIDLIEPGDYVNGAKVVRFKTDENGVKWIYTNNENAYGYKCDEIKSIVTKEQFESMSYKLED